MARQKTQFLCNNCGSVHPKWLGKCPDCGTWDALEEYKPPAEDLRNPLQGIDPDPATGNLVRGGEPVTISNIDQAESPRLPTGIGEFDRILGGGIVPGSAVLVGGEPGIGKSTLLLQVAHALSRGSAETNDDRVTRGQGDKVKGKQGNSNSASVTPSPPHP